MASGAMKTFKTIEEIIEFIKDNANIEKLDSGEITLKEWIEDHKSLEKYKKDYGAATKDKESLRKQKAEFDKTVSELKEQLDSVNAELAGLKEVHTGGDKEALQKLNKEKSELLTQKNTLEAKIRDYEKRDSVIPDLEKQIEGYKAASNRARIWEAMKKAAIARKVPQHIVDDSDTERIVVDDFIIDEAGNIFSKGDSPQSVDNYIAAKQKEKPHWMPTSHGGAGSESMRSESEGGTMPDEQAVLAALFRK